MLHILSAEVRTLNEKYSWISLYKITINLSIEYVFGLFYSLDCVGILKLRNADVEKRIGPSKAKAKKKNSTKARLVFRCTLRKPDGNFFTLQAASTPILCSELITYFLIETMKG